MLVKNKLGDPQELGSTCRPLWALQIAPDKNVVYGLLLHHSAHTAWWIQWTILFHSGGEAWGAGWFIAVGVCSGGCSHHCRTESWAGKRRKGPGSSYTLPRSASNDLLPQLGHTCFSFQSFPKTASIWGISIQTGTRGGHFTIRLLTSFPISQMTSHNIKHIQFNIKSPLSLQLPKLLKSQSSKSLLRPKTNS